DGTGAGVLVRGNEAWYTCIPDLWYLKDEDGDGVAEIKKSLHTGYGVRVALRGHDLHGLVVGPDGKLYFSIGDRGYNVTSQEGNQLVDPGSGAVFRCNFDGSDLELFCVGLRNPQELCFDDYGNLWTGDNNCDAGDRARVVYLMEGGDCGWRMNYQYRPDRGPWMPEGWWKPRFENQATFLNPPIANLTSGPSGMSHYPGTGLPPGYENSFFLADFTGGSNSSGVRRFTVEADGAGYRMDHDETFIGNVLVTDFDFNPDGSMLVSDWVSSWTGVGKGRLWKISAGDEDVRSAGLATGKLLADGFSYRGTAELMLLLGHADRRVRLEAQFSLAAQKKTKELASIALGDGGTLKRIHAIWGLSQIGDTQELLGATTKEADTEIRAQLAKAFGESKNHSAAKELRELLKDPEPRVRYFAAMSLGKLGMEHAEDAKLATEELERRLSANNNQDRFLRHAYSWALARTASDERIATSAIVMPGAAVRMGAVLALRLQNSPRLADFVNDPDPAVACEAARAIYDQKVTGALQALADQLPAMLAPVQGAEPLPKWQDPHIRRMINACWQMGRDQDAQGLFSFAATRPEDDDLRKEALHLLSTWSRTEGFDRMHHEWYSELPRETPTWSDKHDLAAPQVIAKTAVDRGKEVFFENVGASCQRCHWIQGVSTGEAPIEVGPELSSIGLLLTQEELQKSILEPASSIAPGFEIRDASGKALPVSAMTPSLAHLLSEAEISDVVEFLTSLKRPKKILVHVYSAGFEHGVAKMSGDGLSLVGRQWQTWAEKDPRFEVVVDRDPNRFTAEGLAEFDGIFLYTTGELPWPEGGQEAFLEFIEKGGALIGSHCATDTFYEWPAYGELIGGWFDGHPWHEKVGVTVEDSQHLSTTHLQDDFEIVDEIYQFKNWSREGKRVILGLNTDSVDMSRGGIKRKDKDFGISWTRTHGKGRVFYTSLGHRPDVWNSNLFRDHLVGGMLWATRR
ncbi:MAG: ThuA domain-containing protein, partial [Planctomycetes bacterium]|nr:ThuA domain-containing protein [Planctomycetota bacterium]